MTLTTSQPLPHSEFFEMGEDGPTKVSTADIFSGKNVVLFAVPGAFTPTCNNNHLPGFIAHAEAFSTKGVDEICVTACNDVFVMDAWAKSSGGEGKIRFLADPDASFAKSIGMELDLSAFGLGLRSKRYAMLVRDGTVEILNIEENPGEAVTSSAETLLKSL